MARIAPFQGIRYDINRVGSLDNVVAPPYDVISPEYRSELIKKSEWNIVGVDLPENERSTDDDTVRYRRAGEMWQSWLQQGVLSADFVPALYVVEERFTTPLGESGVRRGFVAALELEELGADTVAPHEKTFAAPKLDRLNLMRATHANLSQVFALYRDPERRLDAAFDVATNRKPDMVTHASDGERRVWAVTDAQTIAVAQEVLAASALTIADGHHRYETALTYRNEVRESGGPADADSLMVYVTNMDDPDLTILPYHRVVKLSPNLDINGWRQHIEDAFAVESATTDHPIQWLSDQINSGTGEPYRFGLFTRQWGWELATLRSWDAVEGFIDPTHSDAWRRLDVAVLHEVLLDELARRATVGDSDPVSDATYTVDPMRAEALVRDGTRDVFCMLRATAPEQIGAVVRAGDTMPQKSTYFFPKLLTGLVMRTLNPIEHLPTNSTKDV